jgi:RimJ/RimL family protein N-acetyltransferase/acyl dehydratase
VDALEGPAEEAVILDTERLIVRPWRADDRDAFAVMARDPEVMRFIRGGTPFNDAEIDEFLARQARQEAELGVCMGAMVEKAGGRVVGVAGIQPLGTTGDLEIGWWLRPDMWGRGYATEVAAAAVRHIFETLGRSRVVAIIDPGNDASVRVATRAGLRYDRRTTGAELGHRKPEIVVDLYVRARIDDFQIGQRAAFTKTFTDDDVQRFVAITGDTNPLHVDDAFAARTRFGRRVLHGMLTASILSTMVGMFIPGTGAIYRSQTLSFLRPVYVGETVTAHFVIRAVDRERHRLTIDSWIENAAGERVVEGTCEAGLLREP